MTGLTARSIAIADAETTSTIARTAAQGSLVAVSPTAPAATTTTRGTMSFPPGRATVNRSGHLSIDTCGEGRLGQSTMQPVGRPLMAFSRRRAHDKNPTFVDLETGMITGIRQRLNIIGRPRPGMVCQRDAHNLTSRRHPV